MTTEIHEETLSELFSRDPMNLSNQDLDKIISTMRESRKLWLKDEEKAKAEGKPTRSSAGKVKTKLSPDQVKQISLDDLLGGL